MYGCNILQVTIAAFPKIKSTRSTYSQGSADHCLLQIKTTKKQVDKQTNKQTKQQQKNNNKQQGDDTHKVLLVLQWDAPQLSPGLQTREKVLQQGGKTVGGLLDQLLWGEEEKEEKGKGDNCKAIHPNNQKMFCTNLNWPKGGCLQKDDIFPSPQPSSLPLLSWKQQCVCAYSHQEEEEMVLSDPLHHCHCHWRVRPPNQEQTGWDNPCSLPHVAATCVHRYRFTVNNCHNSGSSGPSSIKGHLDLLLTKIATV